MSIKYKKQLIWMAALLIFVVTGSRVYIYYSSKKMPSYIELSNGNGTLTFGKLHFCRVCFLLINKENAFETSIVNEIINTRATGDIIIINRRFDVNRNNIYESNKSEIEKIIRMVKPYDPSENWIQMYNSEYTLIARYPLERKYKLSIIKALSTEKVINADLSRIFNALRSFLRGSNDGIYFISNRINPSCACYLVYNNLEKRESGEGRFINLVLLGNWTKVEINNLESERNYMTHVILPNEDLKLAEEEWRMKTNRTDFNCIAKIKHGEIRLFPLLKPNDYLIWDAFTKYESKNENN